MQAAKNITIFISLITLILTIALSTILHPIILLIIPIIIIFFLILKNIKLSIAFIFLTSIIGNLIRLNIAGAGGLVLSDFFVPIFCSFYIFKKTFTGEKIKTPKIYKIFSLFIIISFISLLFGVRFLSDIKSILFSFFYLFRFTMYFLLTFIIYDDIKKNPKNKILYTNFALFSGAMIAIAGFIQLLIYPDFGKMAELGWDPHIGRLLSTWYDPNYCAGFFAFLSMICTVLISYSKDKKEKIKLASLLILFLTSLFLTYSRSGYLAFAIPFFIFCIIRAKKILIIILLLSILFTLFSQRTQKRVEDLFYSILYIADKDEVMDSTASMRIKSWKNAGNTIKQNPYLGIGFNTFRYYNAQNGSESKTAESHSSGGSDSSILNIFAMTGIIGGTIFMILLLEIILKANKTKHKKPISIAFIFALCTIILHSCFVNSLFFPFIMIYLWIFAGIAIADSSKKN